MKKALATLLLLGCLLSLATTLVFATSLGSGYDVVASGVTLIKGGIRGKKVSFCEADFKQALSLGDFDSVTITEAPSESEGTLILAGRRVESGTTVKRKNLTSLVFIPTSSDVVESKFKFTVKGDGETTEIECIIKFCNEVNYEPEFDTDSVCLQKTQQNISLYSSLDTAYDAEGDELEYIIVSYADYGSVTLLDKSVGTYCYTPVQDFVGTDSFDYVVRDEWGNYSTVHSVTLEVGERACDAVFIDMQKNADYADALTVYSLGIIDATRVGDYLYFNPDGEVSRAEFIYMALKCAGFEKTDGDTFYDDNADIPTALLSYMHTAQNLGIINATFNGTSLLCRPNDSITRYEAAMIIAELLNIGDEVSCAVFSDINSTPVYARNDLSALCTLGIMNSYDTLCQGEGYLTRAEAVSALCAMLEYD